MERICVAMLLCVSLLAGCGAGPAVEGPLCREDFSFYTRGTLAADPDTDADGYIYTTMESQKSTVTGIMQAVSLSPTG